MQKVEIRWLGGMMFHGLSPSGHDIHLDASPKVGGSDSAPRPMELFAFGLIGCTAMDVVSILSKMKFMDKIEDFRVVMEYERAEDYPKVYRWVRIRYIFKLSSQVPVEKLKRAADLSQQKYCSASAMVKKAVDDFSYEIIVE